MSTNTPFSGKVIALTGAASGIGLETAYLLASRGAKLSLADVQEEALHEAKAHIEKTYQAEALVFALDVRKYDQVEAWITETVKQFGKLDGAANLAGVIPKSIRLRQLKDQDFDEWDFVMGVNSTGVMHCSKHCLQVSLTTSSAEVAGWMLRPVCRTVFRAPELSQRLDAQNVNADSSYSTVRAQLQVMADNGSVVNASSIAGTTGRANNAAYSASKHAVLGLTRAAAKEVGVRGIRVNAICP
jgi:NAD(P)-dependent dehydrogenase (short-subunit alcohol dehydrogenase family)